MRKIFLLLLVLAAWLPGYRAQAQLNKAYFFYAGRSFLIESKYRDCGRSFHILSLLCISFNVSRETQL